MKTYINIIGNGVNVLEVETYYNKGGYNCFTYKEEKRGYYVSVQPLQKSGCMVTFTAFTGAKKLVEECARLSKKRLAELEEATMENAKALIDYVMEKNGLEFA